MTKKRVNVYIDGFNLYHSALQHTYPECRWLNLVELSKRLINPKTEEIQMPEQITYNDKTITAPSGWLPVTVSSC